MNSKTLVFLIPWFFLAPAISENLFDKALEEAHQNAPPPAPPEDNKKRFTIKELFSSSNFTKIGLQNTLDTQRFRLGQLVERSATWADGLFGDIDPESYENHSYITLGTYYDWNELGTNELNFRVRSKIHLPVLKKRFKLMVESTSESLFKEDVTGTNDDFDEIDQNTDNSNTLSSAVGWTLKHTKKLFVDLKVGLKVGSPLEPYAKSKFIRHFKLSNTWNFDFEQNLFAIINDETGATSAFKFSKRFSPNRTMNIRTYGIMTDKEDLRWSQGISYFQNLGSTRAYSVSADVGGATEPKFRIESYRLGTHYRQSFFRPWLFIYASPALVFPRTEDWNAIPQFRIGVDAIISTRAK